MDKYFIFTWGSIVHMLSYPDKVLFCLRTLKFKYQCIKFNWFLQNKNVSLVKSFESCHLLFGLIKDTSVLLPLSPWFNTWDKKNVLKLEARGMCETIQIRTNEATFTQVQSSIVSVQSLVICEIVQEMKGFIVFVLVLFCIGLLPPTQGVTVSVMAAEAENRLQQGDFMYHLGILLL